MINFAAGLLLFAAFLFWRWTADRFKSLNKWADRLEKRLPRFLRWPPDPISWLHHSAFTATAGLGLGLWAWLTLGTFGIGFASGASVMAAFYAIREGRGIYLQWGNPGMWWRGWPNLTGWFVDGVMDFLCPLAVAVCAWWMA